MVTFLVELELEGFEEAVLQIIWQVGQRRAHLYDGNVIERDGEAEHEPCNEVADCPTFLLRILAVLLSHDYSLTAKQLSWNA